MDEWTGAGLIAALSSAWVWLRRRRMKWRVRGHYTTRRFRVEASVRSHDSAPAGSVEPPPFPSGKGSGGDARDAEDGERNDH